MSEQSPDPQRREGRMLVILGSVLLGLSLVVAATLPVFGLNDRDVLNPTRGPVIATVGIPIGLVILIVGVVRLTRARRRGR